MKYPNPILFVLISIIVSCLAVGAYGVAIYFGFMAICAGVATSRTRQDFQRRRIQRLAARRRLQPPHYPGDQPPSSPIALGDWLSAIAAAQGIPAKSYELPAGQGARATQLDALVQTAPYTDPRTVQVSRQTPPACTEDGPCRAVDRITVNDPAGNRVGSLCTRCNRRRAWLPFLENGATS
jgi:hypothetical protein